MLYMRNVINRRFSALLILLDLYYVWVLEISDFFLIHQLFSRIIRKCNRAKLHLRLMGSIDELKKLAFS